MYFLAFLYIFINSIFSASPHDEHDEIEKCLSSSFFEEKEDVSHALHSFLDNKNKLDLSELSINNKNNDLTEKALVYIEKIENLKTIKLNGNKEQIYVKKYLHDQLQ